MADYQVKCVVRKGGKVEHYMVTGLQQCGFTAEAMASAIRSDHKTFEVVAGQYRAEVEAFEVRKHTWSVRTKRDATPLDNLKELPECPDGLALLGYLGQ